jgi:hypothetical protein
MPAGSWIIDLDCKRKKIWGYTRVTDPLLRLKAGVEPDVIVVIEYPAIKPANSLRSFRLSASEKLSLVDHASLLLARSNDKIMPLKEAVEILDSNAV